jgi:adenosylhomocysteine nucleosidase
MLKSFLNGLKRFIGRFVMAAENEDEQLQCDVLILVTTTSEREQLEAAAKQMGLSFQKRTHSKHGRYYSLGTLGHNRVHAVRTEGMGPLGYGGSASKSVLFRAATGATGLIQLGMAFGVDPMTSQNGAQQGTQNKGDVLVSTSLIPYDNRDVIPAAQPAEVFPMSEEPTVDQPDSRADPVARPAAATGYSVDYQTRVQRHQASPSLLRILRTGYENGTYDYQVFFGGMLSGGARIFSSAFLRELVNGVPAAEDGIIGGDMEGVGLLASSPRDNPVWVVVKGISDFANDERHRGIDAAARTAACRNSASFVLDALQKFKVE